MDRVLYVNQTAVHGGAEEVLLRFMTSARGMRLEPVLIVPRSGWLTDRCKELDIPVEVLPDLPDAIVNENWRQQLRPLPRTAVAISRLVRKWKAKLVHSNSPRGAYHGGLGARLAGVPAVSHVHDIENLPFQSGTKARILQWLTRRFLVPSLAVQRAILSQAPFLGPRIQVLYNGWSPDVYASARRANLRAEFGLPPETILVGSAAAMTPWKGQDVLVEAMALARRHCPELRLLLVGGSQGRRRQDEFEASLHRRVAELGMREVIFTGWREDIWPILKDVDVYVHVPTEPDPLPTSLLHAIALGKAAIGSNIGGVPEILNGGQVGLIVPSGDAEQTAAALVRLARDSQLREALGLRGRRHFEATFTEDQLAAGLQEAYAAVLAQA